MPPRKRDADPDPETTAEPGLAVDPEAISTEGSVDKVQQLLLAKGYSFDRTGTMTAATIDAITHFQVSNGLEPTGVVGRGDDPTWRALNK